jgi:hypothetical protein
MYLFLISVSIIDLYLKWMSIEVNEVYKIVNKKLWEELISYFPLIRHEPHRKRREQFLVAAGKCLPSRCLATIGGYTDRPTDSPLIRHGPHRKRCVQQFFYCCMCIRCRGNVFTEPLPSKIYIQTPRLIGGIYKACRSDGLRCHDMTHTRFHKV